MALINEINANANGNGNGNGNRNGNRSNRNIRHRNSSITAGLSSVELTTINCGNNSSIKSFWLYRFVRVVAVIIGLLMLAALPLSATVLLLAALPLVLAAADPDKAH